MGLEVCRRAGVALEQVNLSIVTTSPDGKVRSVDSVTFLSLHTMAWTRGKMLNEGIEISSNSIPETMLYAVNAREKKVLKYIFEEEYRRLGRMLED